jgi:hypothetical protein
VNEKEVPRFRPVSPATASLSLKTCKRSRSSSSTRTFLELSSQPAGHKFTLIKLHSNSKELQTSNLFNFFFLLCHFFYFFIVVVFRSVFILSRKVESFNYL